MKPKAGELDWDRESELNNFIYESGRQQGLKEGRDGVITKEDKEVLSALNNISLYIQRILANRCGIDMKITEKTLKKLGGKK